MQSWQPFKQVNELFILVPMLLNLKGNLEMNLSARLSTSANIGELDTRSVRRAVIQGNLALLQVQAIGVSCIAACLSFIMGRILPSGEANPPLTTRTRPHPHLPPPTTNQSGLREFIIVLSTAIFSAGTSSLILGSFMCSLILLCRKLRLNPDNIAPPIASALGDLLTLTLLGFISRLLLDLSYFLHAILLFVAFFVFAACLAVATRNTHTAPLLRQGWTPLFMAMFISFGTGIVLDSFVLRYRDYALMAVVMGGVPGSVGSIYISRLSTMLHADADISLQSPAQAHHAIRHARPKWTSLSLFLVTLPVQAIFLTAVYLARWLTLPAVFIPFWSTFFCLTVCPIHRLDYPLLTL